MMVWNTDSRSLVPMYQICRHTRFHMESYLDCRNWSSYKGKMNIIIWCHRGISLFGFRYRYVLVHVNTCSFPCSTSKRDFGNLLNIQAETHNEAWVFAMQNTPNSLQRHLSDYVSPFTETVLTPNSIKSGIYLPLKVTWGREEEQVQQTGWCNEDALWNSRSSGFRYLQV